MGVSARAIAPSIFLVTALTGGCGPDLTRQDGRLELRISGIDGEITEIWVQVTVPGGDAPYLATPATSGATLNHVVETVPAGTATVEVLGLEGAEVEQRWQGTVTITADRTTEIAVRLSEDGGGPFVVSAPFELVVGPVTGADIVDTRLRGTAAAPADVVSAFLEQARTTLGTAPTTIQLASARVAVRDAEAEGLDDLDEAWRNDLTLLGVPGEVALATTVLGEDIDAASLAPSTEDRTAFWQAAAAGGATLALEGRARREAQDDFSVQVTLTIVLSAR